MQGVFQKFMLCTMQLRKIDLLLLFFSENEMEPQNILVMYLTYLEGTGHFAPCKIPTDHRNHQAFLSQTFLE